MLEFSLWLLSEVWRPLAAAFVAAFVATLFGAWLIR